LERRSRPFRRRPPRNRSCAAGDPLPSLTNYLAQPARRVPQGKRRTCFENQARQYSKGFATSQRYFDADLLIVSFWRIETNSEKISAMLKAMLHRRDTLTGPGDFDRPMLRYERSYHERCCKCSPALASHPVAQPQNPSWREPCAAGSVVQAEA
jgi:hypothetical protein